MRIFVACAPGLEPLLSAEVRELGAGDSVEIVAGGVELEGDATMLHRAHLELGLASHVLVRIADFRAPGFPELAQRAAKVRWRDWLRPGEPIRLRARARASRLYHTGGIVERVRGAIERQLGALPDADADDDSPSILARMERDRCTLSLDTSGAPLHRRGYRLASAKAPLREDLARALVRASGWDPGTPLADPFCGSGTIAIEAALLARRIAPGRLRSFALERTPLFEQAIWERLREDAAARALPHAPSPIFASDRDAGAVEAARGNAERAGVLSDLQLDQATLSRAPFAAEPIPPRGALVTNPPHGRRIGDDRGLRPLYQSLGALVRRLPPEWRIALLVSHRRLALATGLPLETALLTDQGGTKVRVMLPRRAAAGDSNRRMQE